MKSKILITNLDNIDFHNSCVIDNEKILTEVYDSDMDVLIFENIKTNRQRRANLMNVSLYDDLIVREETKYKILRMLSAPSF